MKLTEPHHNMPKLRDIIGMTQKELAEEAGLSLKQVNHILQGRSFTTYRAAKRLAAATNTKPEHWMENKGLNLIRIIARANGKLVEEAF